MKKLSSYFFGAPKSTILAIVTLLILITCKATGIIESEAFVALSTIVIPLMFTDILREKKTGAE